MNNDSLFKLNITSLVNNFKVAVLLLVFLFKILIQLIAKINKEKLSINKSWYLLIQILLSE